MIATRYRKSLRDVLERRGRSLLTVVAMAAAVFQITMMLEAYALLRPELRTMYGRTRPASATLVIEGDGDSLVEAVRRVPGVAAAECRPVIVARVRVAAGEWVPALFQVVPDFDRQQLDRFTPDRGQWPPGPGDVLLERTALRVAGVRVGDSIIVRTAAGADMRVRVAGTVHAPGLPPAWMEHMVPAFIARESALRGAEAGESTQLRLVATHPLDEGFIRELADTVRARLERSGHAVSRVTIPTPGRHPHADQMEAFLFLLLAFGGLSFLLSGVLLAGMVHAAMSEQVRQVGIMKALGATRVQVVGIYLAQVGVLSAAALVLGVLPGLWVGSAYARFSAGILNTDVSRSPFPVWVVGLVSLLGMIVPLLMAVGPVWRASRISVCEAIAGDAPPLARMRRLDALLTRIPALPRPLALSLRHTFARRARLALAIGLLAVGGAVFMAALNVASDWRRSVDEDFARRRYDLMVGFETRHSVREIAAMLAAIPGVASAEYWPGETVWLVGTDGVAGVTAALAGPEVGSPMMDARIIAGHGLSNLTPRAVVVNQAVIARVGPLAPGDLLRVRTHGRTVAFAVAGIARELTPMPVIYAPRALVLETTGQSGDSSRSVRVVASGRDDRGPREVARAIERECERRGLAISGMQRMQDAKQGILDHLVIILSILTMASLVVVFVGAIGLAATLTLSVIQRTREIGVMSALGASPWTLARHVGFEGVLTGVLSWAAACVLSVPLSLTLEAVCGRIFFKVPLDPWIAPEAPGTWLALVLIVASICSVSPALRAARMPVREALSQT